MVRRGRAQDFTDLHAWAEVYLPGAGWVGLDPTSGLLAGGRSYSAGRDARAGLGGAGQRRRWTQCEVEFVHEMSVTRIHEDPRVTLPYTDEQWQRIDALGDRVDAEIRRSDMRLTMGGEPTFVSIDNMDGAEWNNAATGAGEAAAGGAAARSSASALRAGRAAAFRDRQMVSGRAAAALGAHLLLAHGRSCRSGTIARCWPTRRTNRTLDRPTPSTSRKRWRGAWVSIPSMRIRRSKTRSTTCSKERQLPVNVDPVDNQLEDAGERERLRRVFERGLDQPTGFVFPLQRGGRQERTRVADRPVDAARPAPVPDAGRFAGRPAPAAAQPAVGRVPRNCRKRSPVDPMANRGTAAGAARASRRPIPCCRDRTIGNASATASRQPGESAPWVVRTALVRGAARRPPVCLHAAAALGRRLPRPGHRHRGHGGASGHAGGDRRLPAALRPAHPSD